MDTRPGRAYQPFASVDIAVLKRVTRIGYAESAARHASAYAVRRGRCSASRVAICAAKVAFEGNTMPMPLATATVASQ